MQICLLLSKVYELLGNARPQVGTTRSLEAIKRECSITLPQDAKAIEVADLPRQRMFVTVLGNYAATRRQKLR